MTISPNAPTGYTGGLHVDKIPVERLFAAIAKNPKALQDTGRFWSSGTNRSTEDRTFEVLEVELNGARPVNHISFEVSNIANRTTAEYWDAKKKRWEPLRYMRYAGDSSLVTAPQDPMVPSERWDPKNGWVRDPASVDEGVPVSNVVTTPSPGAEGLHTYGRELTRSEWFGVNWRTRPVETSRIRLLIQRVPTNILGAPESSGAKYGVFYKIGVRNLEIGYRINGIGDVPRDTQGQSFASTTDLLGSRVVFSLTEHKAANVQKPTGAWRSSPQPVKYAIVNFYADTRDVTGQGQVIDRFFLDPLTVGPKVNLYYSNDDPSGGFVSSDDPLVYPLAQPHGESLSINRLPQEQSADSIGFSVAYPSYVDIDNTYLQFDPRKAWWLGLEVRTSANYDGWVEGSADGIIDHPWVSIGGSVLRQNGPSIEFITEHGDVATIPLDPDQLPGSQVHRGVLYNPTDTPEYPKGLTLVYRLGDRAPETVTWDVRNLTTRPTFVRLGGYPDLDAVGVPAFGVRALTLKPVQARVDDVMWFTEGGQDYVTRDPFQAYDSGSTDNSLLRMHPIFSDPDGNNVPGLIGGPGDRFAEMTWAPISRDYALKRGFMHIPPTRAKYWKFEITNLVAEPYESFVPIQREVLLHSAQTVREYNEVYGTESAVAPDSGVRTLVSLGDISRYSDAIEAMRQMPPGHSPTEALYSPNLSSQQSISDLGWIWRYEPWQVGASAPRFIHTQRHFYETIKIEHRTKVGYFAGLKTLDAYRVNYLADDDTEQYTEHFLDAQNIESISGFSLGDSRVVSLGHTGEIVSKTMLSQRPVRAIQFATTQSEAVPLLEDDGFLDDDLTNHWDVYGDAEIERTSANTVRVNRGWYQRRYGQIETQAEFRSYGGMEGRLYGEIEGGQPNGLAGGGIESEPIEPSNSGRLYVAARVTSTEGLSGPVEVQIVSTQGDVVLASAVREISPGEEADVFVGYTVGAATVPLTYADMAATGDGTYGAIEGIREVQVDYPVVDESGEPVLDPETNEPLVETVTETHFTDTPYGTYESRAIESPVYARVIQQGPSTDRFEVHRLSLFDAASSWEFSVDDGTTWYDALDIRNDPNGVLNLPETGTELKWRLRTYKPGVAVSALSIRPWYLGLAADMQSGHGLIPGGPNLSVVDAHPPIEQDPMWRQWDQPIPRSWYEPVPLREADPVPEEPSSSITPSEDPYRAPVQGEAEDVLDEVTDLVEAEVEYDLLTDTFTGPNAETTLHDVDRETELQWTVIGPGRFGVHSNQAVAIDLTEEPTLAITDTLRTEGSVAATFVTTLEGRQGLVFRSNESGTHYWLLRPEGLFKIVGGVEETVAVFAPGGDGDRYTATYAGDAVVAQRNGVELATTTDSFNADQTYAGLWRIA